jgi:hypothetical protein
MQANFMDLSEHRLVTKEDCYALVGMLDRSVCCSWGEGEGSLQGFYALVGILDRSVWYSWGRGSLQGCNALVGMLDVGYGVGGQWIRECWTWVKVHWWDLEMLDMG